MSTIKDWLELAKQHNLQVINESTTDDLALCINLLTIPTTTTVAVTVSFLKNHKKKNAAPPQVFARAMTVLERLMRGIDDEGYDISDRFQVVNLSTQWYYTLNCHRIFFITESSTPVFVSEVMKQKYIQAFKNLGIKEMRYIANTTHYQFNIKF